MNSHKHARLTPKGRALLVRRVREEGWTVGAAAEAAGVSRRTGFKWLARFKVEGAAGLLDRSSRPGRCPRACSAQEWQHFEDRRRQRAPLWRIAKEAGRSLATLSRCMRSLGLSRLRSLEPAEPVVRYERAAPGELLHIDTKRLGRIQGVGHRITRDRTKNRNRGIGWDHLHVAIDDASRLAYTEILPGLTSQDAAGFLERALAWYARLGVRVERVMTDNGSAYVSKLFAKTIATAGVRHIRTRPFRPRTNGKAERFIQTSLREWAYARPYISSAQRTAAVGPWTDGYNLHRPHAGIGDLSPWQKLNNLLGNDT